MKTSIERAAKIINETVPREMLVSHVNMDWLTDLHEKFAQALDDARRDGKAEEMLQSARLICDLRVELEAARKEAQAKPFPTREEFWKWIDEQEKDAAYAGEICHGKIYDYLTQFQAAPSFEGEINLEAVPVRDISKRPGSIPVVTVSKEKLLKLYGAPKTEELTRQRLDGFIVGHKLGKAQAKPWPTREEFKKWWLDYRDADDCYVPPNGFETYDYLTGFSAPTVEMEMLSEREINDRIEECKQRLDLYAQAKPWPSREEFMDWFWDTFSNYNAPRYVAEKSYDYLTQFQAAPTVELPPKGAVMLRIDEKHHAVASLIYDEIARFSRIKPGQSEKKEGA